MRKAIVDTTNNFFSLNGCGMGRIDMPTQSEKAQTHKNQPMKRSRDIYGIFKKNSKLLVENIKTFSQKQNVEKTFCLSQDMTEYVGNGEKLLEE